MKITLRIGSVLWLTAATAAAVQAPIYPAPAKPMQANYVIYSGGLGDEQAPTSSDRKLSIRVSGIAAKEIFDSIYPDSKTTCGDEKGERLRAKGETWCFYSPRGGYRCFIGLDLRTGKSIAGGSC